jgi:hypothetical protein
MYDKIEKKGGGSGKKDKREERERGTRCVLCIYGNRLHVKRRKENVA